MAKALQIKTEVKLSASYRMMEFTTLGYAIAESIGDGLGEKFMEAMKRNEQYQLREMKKSEPLIQTPADDSSLQQQIKNARGKGARKPIRFIRKPIFLKDET